jgi:hypothetical protein
MRKKKSKVGNLVALVVNTIYRQVDKIHCCIVDARAEGSDRFLECRSESLSDTEAASVVHQSL